MDKITEYPLFGKVNLVETFLGDIGYKSRGCISTPAISGGESTLKDAVIYSDVPVHIFSNGSEADSWCHYNCRRCKKYLENNLEPTALREGGCALEMRIGIAYLDDGKIPFKTAKRIGFDNLHIQRNGVFVNLGKCKEFESKK